MVSHLQLLQLVVVVVVAGRRLFYTELTSQFDQNKKNGCMKI
jgi:hypothetical protein